MPEGRPEEIKLPPTVARAVISGLMAATIAAGGYAASNMRFLTERAGGLGVQVVMASNASSLYRTEREVANTHIGPGVGDGASLGRSPDLTEEQARARAKRRQALHALTRDVTGDEVELSVDPDDLPF